MSQLECFPIEGDSHEIGRRLGELARPHFDAYMAQSPAWQKLRHWRGHPFVAALRAAAVAAFPQYIAELDGMAEGLGWPADDLFVWNCRGELTHRAADGCTTLAVATASRRAIAHNEDGDPYLLERGRCFLVDAKPAGQPGFISFCYPGSLPGHTFAVTRAGLAQTINNVRILDCVAGVPRMILARAVLDARSLDEALSLLRGTPSASGFHHTVGCAGDSRIVSIEATARGSSMVPVHGVYGHANHLIHPEHNGESQIVTASSRDRQTRLAQLLPRLQDDADDEALLRTLRDRAPDGLPIYRDDSRDPDGENTLATALLTLESSGVAMRIHRRGQMLFERFVERSFIS